MSLTRWKSSPGGHCANRTGTGPDMLGNIKFFIKLGQNVPNMLSVDVDWGILTETHMVFWGLSPPAKKEEIVNNNSRLLPMKKLVEKSDWNVNRLLALHWNLPSRASSDSCFRNILQRHVQHTRRINPMQIQLSNLPKITYVLLFASRFESNVPTTTPIDALNFSKVICVFAHKKEE